MDRAHPFLTRLRAVMQSLDDDALASLANKGLLRRAQKDVQSQRPTIVDVTDERVRLQAADATVDVPELPVKSRCSCPATGVCRHVLMSLVYLRDDPEIATATAREQPTPSAADVSPEGGPTTAAGASDTEPSSVPQPAAIDPAALLSDVSDDELIRWAGKALFRKAMKSLVVHSQVEVETTPAFIVRFPSRNVTCRWIPSGGLLGMLCSCQSEAVCEHVVAAILAYQASLGRRMIEQETSALTESSGAPRTRAEVLESVLAVVRELTALGLARISAGVRQRLTTLAVSAHGVDLPRLERMLKSLADDVDLALRRDAQAALSGLLWQASRVEAVCTALFRKPSPGLIGVHRTQYSDVGQITVIGLGAYRWRSKGGYHGLTLIFWDESRGAWSTWSESRPVTQPGFDPAARFRAEGPWLGCNSPQVAACSTLRLSGAWRNAHGRISGRPSTRALVVGPADPQVIPEAIVEWSALSERIRNLFGGGLAERIEHQELVLLAPKAWGPAFFDPLRQELIRPLVDAQGQILELWLPFNPENESAVELLEKYDARQTRGVLGALRWVGGTVRVQPISLIEPERIVHLNLEGTGKPNAKPNAKPKSAAAGAAMNHGEEETELLGGDVEEDDDFDEAATAAAASGLSRLLATAEAELEAIAESGVGVRRDLSLLEGVARRLQQFGFAACAKSLDRLLECSKSVARSTDGDRRTKAAAALLRSYYVVRLAAEQEAVALACGQLGE